MLVIKNTGYKNMPVISTLAVFTRSFVFYSIEIFYVYSIVPIYRA